MTDGQEDGEDPREPAARGVRGGDPDGRAGGARARRSAALRENLRRRKAQSRARRAGDDAPATDRDG
ncbi:MAG: hypothetical protein ACFBWO_17270 [Paracoccaceae bacterium]